MSDIKVFKKYHYSLFYAIFIKDWINNPQNIIHNNISNFWNSFAEQVGGSFTEGQYDRSDKVEIEYKGWTIVFDNHTLKTIVDLHSYEQTYTRVTALIESIDDFRFEIHPQNILNSITKIFGAQDIVIGDAAFDKKFFLKSNSEMTLKSLLLNEKLKTAIENITHFNLQISNQRGIWEDKLSDGQLELAYFEKGEKVHSTGLNQ